MAVTKENNSQRVPLVAAVECKHSDARPSRVLSMLDLSEGGVFVQTAYPSPVGTKVQCVFHLGDSPDPVSSEGIVAWIRNGSLHCDPPAGMGIRFLNLQEDDALRIRKIIAVHNSNAEYFQKFNRLPEDAMALDPPRLQLKMEDMPRLKAELNGCSSSFMVATVALPFLKKGKEIQAELADGTSLEKGKISWLNFEQSNGVPGIKMGIELSLSSWGENNARKITGPLEISTSDTTQETIIEIDDLEDENLEVLVENKVENNSGITRSLASGNSFQPDNNFSDQRSNSAMDLPLPPPQENISANETPSYPLSQIEESEPAYPRQINQALLKDEVGKNKRISKDLKRVYSAYPPPPQENSDTYPILSEDSKNYSRLKKLVLLGVGVVAILLGGIKLFGKSDKKVHKNFRATVGSNSDKTGTPPFKKKSINTVCRGNPHELPGIKVEKKKDIYKVAGQEKESSEEKSNSVKEPSVKTEKITGQKALRVSQKGRLLKLTLSLDKKKADTSFYLLANPEGVVFDVKGAKFLLAEGYHKVENKKIRKIKILTTSKGGRAIVYTKKLPKNVKTDVSQESASLSFH
ncbi:MAG: PilZ domain-containing protein [Myxococcota bacterium]